MRLPHGKYPGQAGKTFIQQHAEDPGTWVNKGPNYPVKSGGVVTFFTPGGGGYGRTEQRSPELIERDRKLGYKKAIL